MRQVTWLSQIMGVTPRLCDLCELDPHGTRLQAVSPTQTQESNILSGVSHVNLIKTRIKRDEHAKHTAG